MNMMQRALRSVCRKWVRTLLLCAVVSAVSLLLLCGVAGGSASVQTLDTTRQAIGAGFRLEMNQASRHRALMRASEKIDGEGVVDGVHLEKIETQFGPQWLCYTDNFFECIPVEDILKIAGVPGVRDYSVSTAFIRVVPADFQRVEDPDVDQSSDIGCVCLVGCRKMSLDSRVASGDAVLVAGREIQPEDTDVCVISQALAEVSGRGLGDTLSFHSRREPESSPIQTATVIGIYRPSPALQPLMSGDTYRWDNVIFTDLHFPEKAENDTPLFQTAYFQAEDVNQYDELKADILSLPIDWEQYDLIDRDGKLDVLSANFNDLKSASTLLMLTAVIGGFLILFLIFLLCTRGRAREMGVLLSLGIRKRSILGQLLLEAAAVAALAFLLSFAVCPGLTQAAVNQMVRDQVTQAQRQQDAQAAYVYSEAQTASETVVGTQVRLSPAVAALCGVGITALTCFSAGAASAAILRKKPIDIIDKPQ